jgi:hypothetical protein
MVVQRYETQQETDALLQSAHLSFQKTAFLQDICSRVGEFDITKHLRVNSILQISQKIRGNTRNAIRLEIIILCRELPSITASCSVQRKRLRASDLEMAILHISCVPQVISPCSVR